MRDIIKKFCNNITIWLFIPIIFMNSVFCISLSSSANSSSHEEVVLKKTDWPFEGVFGMFDRQAAQRGFQVYKEVCSVCHGMSHLSYRNLMDLGFSEEEAKTIAAEYSVTDGPNDKGEMFERAAILSDKFVHPYKNEEEAKLANNGAIPPSLDLIVKARHDGPNYIYSLLTGYSDPPKGFVLMPGLSYNKYFTNGNHQIAMPAPLSDGQVSYSDGTVATVDQMARDVIVFLQWSAEPEMERRKAMGLKVILFLTIYTYVCFLSKKRIWSRLKDEQSL